MKKVLLPLLSMAVWGWFLPLATAQHQTKIGFVNVTRVFETTKEGQDILKRLKDEFGKKQTELDGRMKAYEEKAKQFQAQMAMLKDDVKKERMQALAKEEYELGMLLRQYQGDINTKKAEALGKFEEKVIGIVQQVAQKEGLEYVLRQETLLHAPLQMDLTNEIIREYDKTHSVGQKGK
jgi:outer membrane protein